MAARARKPPIPLTVVAGPLGAGKTTLINRALADPAFGNTAVILNEFGEVPLAGGLVARAEDGIVALAGGCVCCAVRGELIDTLENLLRDLDNGRIAALRRVVIEANAEADPSAILAGIGMHPYLPLRFVPDGIVTVIAADDVAALDPATARQLAMADVIAVTKADDLGAVAGPIARLNPVAAIVDAGKAEPTLLAGHGPFDPAATDIRQWLGPADAAGGAHALAVFTVRRERSMPLAALDRFLDYLAALQGPNLIRVRGLVAVADGESAVVEGIGAFFSPPRLIPSPPAETATRFSVTAAGGFDGPAFEAYLDTFLNEARIDSPDRAAVTDNPLRVTGFSARPGR